MGSAPVTSWHGVFVRTTLVPSRTKRPAAPAAAAQIPSPGGACEGGRRGGRGAALQAVLRWWRHPAASAAARPGEDSSHGGHAPYSPHHAPGSAARSMNCLRKSSTPKFDMAARTM
jgi:hypothetical protein